MHDIIIIIMVGAAGVESDDLPRICCYYRMLIFSGDTRGIR